MDYFAIIDTETNWIDQVMSIGVVIAHRCTFQAVDAKYYVLTPECEIGGMYEQVLFPDQRLHPVVCDREAAMMELLQWLGRYGVTDIFAYNAGFDYNHLPELSKLQWYDIIRLAAYRQFNPHIPACAQCCSTGRMKRNYGVEPMLRLLSGNGSYHETHNALYDAMDELQIMRLLGYSPDAYLPMKTSGKKGRA